MVRPEKYVNDSAISQSDLTLFEKNIVDFHTAKILGLPIEEKKSDALDLGSIVDNVLLDPENLKNYYVLTEFKASGKEKEVADIVFGIIRGKIQAAVDKNEAKESALSPMKWPKLVELEVEILEAIEVNKYQPNWRTQTRLDKIKENCAEYFEQIKEADGKYIVTMEIWTKAHRLAELIKDGYSTSNVYKLLKGELPEKVMKRYIIHKSRDLYGVDPATGKRLKALLDFFIEDTKEMTITPWDLKTAKSILQFWSNYRASRYGRQKAFYWELLRQNFPNHKILLPRFLVIPTTTTETPEIFQMDEGELEMWTKGGDSQRGYSNKGFQELLVDLAWHEKENKWQHNRSYYELGYNVISTSSVVDSSLLVDNDTVVF